MKARIDNDSSHVFSRLAIQDRAASRTHEGERSHRVKQGERLPDLVAKYRVATSAIVAANPSLIRDASLSLSMGDTLVIPDEAEARLAPYVVQAGETLDDIVAGQNLDMRTVAQDNGLEDGDGVRAGDTLLLPPEQDTDAPQGFRAPGEGSDGDISGFLFGADEANAQEQETMLEFSRNFETLDENGDGIVGEQELQYVVEHPDEFGGSQSAAVQAATAMLAPSAVPPDDSLVLFPNLPGQAPTVYDRMDAGADYGITSTEVAEALANMAPPANASMRERAEFDATRLQALDRAMNRGRLDEAQAEALRERIYADLPNDPEAAAALLGAYADLGATPEQIVAVLDGITADMSSDEVDAVLAEVAPLLEQAAAVRHQDRGDDRRDYERDQEYAAVADFYGTLARISDRAGEAGNAAIADALAPSFPDGDLEAIDDALGQAVDSGSGLALVGALVTALTAAGKTDGAQDVVAVVDEDDILADTGEHVQDYAELTEQYFYALQMRSLFTDEASFTQALDALMTRELGEDWEQQIADAQAAMAADGAMLLTRLYQFRDSDEVVAMILEDPASLMAIGTALVADPTLVQGESGPALLELCADLGIIGAENPLAALVVDAYIRNNVLLPMGDASLSPQAREAAIGAALVGNDALAQVLGVGDSDSEAYAALTEELSALASAGAPVEFDPVSGTIEVSGGFGNVIDEISDLDLPPDMERILKGAALGIAGIGLIDAAGELWDQPSLDAAMSVLVDAAGVGVAGGEFVQAVRGLSGESTLLTVGNKFLYVLGMGSATLDAFDRIGEGDWVGAGLNFAIAGGLFQAAVAGGPIGVSIAAGAQVVLFAYDGWRAALHNNRFENDAQRDFLAASGLSAEAADVLFDTSGEALSPVPFLLRYCELSGLTVEQAIDYLNSLPEDALRALRQAVHHTTDDMDGGIADFAASDAQDDVDFEQQLDESGLSPDTYSLNDPTFDLLGGPVDRPETAAQLDALLQRIGVQTPSEWAAAQ